MPKSARFLRHGASRMLVMSVRHYQLVHYLQRLMASFVDKLFTKKSFEASHVLADNVDDLKDKHILMPDGTRYAETIFYEAISLSMGKV